MNNATATEQVRFIWLPAIGCLFSASLLLANTLDSKIIALGALTFPAGIIVFPLSYLFGDVITEVYGLRVARSIIWAGFASLGLMAISYVIVGALPAAGFWHEQGAYDAILGRVPRIVGASMIAYLLGELANSYTLSILKIRFRGKVMAIRFVASTAVGQVIDTTIFCLMAFGGVVPARSLPSLVASGWAFKVIWEVLALPLTLLVVRFLKSAEREDHYDSETDLRFWANR